MSNDPAQQPAQLSQLGEQKKKLEDSAAGADNSPSRALYEAEKSSLDLARQNEDLREARAKNQAIEDNLGLRKEYAHRAIDLAEWAVWFWICMFIAVGVANGVAGRPILSDKALVTLTAGATINVLAAFIGIIRGLFPNPSRE